ncbi:MAG: hypothetical protein WD274_04955, partial [Acidimicrobiia bacterium]
PPPPESTSTTAPRQTSSSISVAQGTDTSISRIQPVRTITPDEWAFVIGQCMQERGIDVNIIAADHLNYQGVPAVQRPRIAEVREECMALYPLDDRYTGGLSEKQLTRLYAYYVDTLVPCLGTEGYSGFSPPSLTTYLETYGTEGEWHPYTDIIEIVDQLNPGAFTSLTQVCPQSPGTEYLFGE